MPNPITPSGRRSPKRIEPIGDSFDITENARRQDEERRIGEDNAFFEKTGINPKPYEPVDPLVPINGYVPPPVADDGDSYIDMDGYVDDEPTRLIDPDVPRSLKHATKTERQAYFEREKIKEQREMKVKVEKNSKKYKNPIIGLEIK
jgi:hypothetical protein